jgi:hypothetical protein
LKKYYDGSGHFLASSIAFNNLVKKTCKFYDGIDEIEYTIMDNQTFLDEKISFLFHKLNFTAQRQLDFILNHLDM